MFKHIFLSLITITNKTIIKDKYHGNTNSNKMGH